MTINEIIKRARDLKPCDQFTDVQLTAWIAALEGKIAADVFLMDISEIRQLNYKHPEDGEKKPLVEFPHDDIYVLWLLAQIDAANEEYNRYQNALVRYNDAFGNFVRWFASTYEPAQDGCGVQKRCGVHTYYITAYGLAVRQGFRGSLDEWLESLDAFGVAKKAGFAGTREEWLQTLTAYGLAQKNGFNGTQDEWLESLDAYGVAKKAGFAGTKEEWLQTLTAYGLAEKSGFDGTLDEWLASLKGDKGDRGEQGIQGKQGVSGVYVGSGEMPEGYNVQIDPEGEAANIAEINDTVVGADAWSGKNIVDRLCPGFTEKGSVVTCQPVEGYPLKVATRIDPVQSGTGDPSPENIRPITGFENICLQHSGKNLMDTRNVFLYGATNIAGIPNRLKAGQTYTITLYNITNTFSLWLSEDKGTGYKPIVSTIASGVPKTFTAPDWVNDRQSLVLVGAVGSGAGTDSIDTFYGQIESGSASTEYEPYRGQEFTADFGQTVYGGSYDWQTGVLTVTQGCIENYDGEAVPEGWISSTGELSQGAQVVYLLEDPESIQLTPQELFALSGENVLYSNTGDTAVTGKADPTTIIEKLTNAILALGGNV